MDRPRRQDHGVPGSGGSARALARPAHHLHRAAGQGAAQSPRRGRQGDRRDQYLGPGQARLPCRRQAVRAGARRRHVAADLPQGYGGQARARAAQDLGRSPRQRQGAHPGPRRRRPDRHLRHRAPRRQSVHQHHLGRADQGQRRDALRQGEPAAAHRQENARDPAILGRARQVCAAGLGGPQLPADLPEPLRAEGRHDVPGLRPRRRLDREVRAQGDGQRQDVRCVGQAARAERHASLPCRWTRSPGCSSRPPRTRRRPSSS